MNDKETSDKKSHEIQAKIVVGLLAFIFFGMPFLLMLALYWIIKVSGIVFCTAISILCVRSIVLDIPPISSTRRRCI